MKYYLSTSVIAIAIVLTASPTAICPKAMAQSPSAPEEQAGAATGTSGGSIADIIVTARRQSESLINVPVQVTVQSGEQLARVNANDLPKIAETIPFVTITKLSGGNGGAFIVRGLGATGSDVGIQQTVLLNIDNVFIGRGRIVAQGFYDIGQVEVLKGPQALFYGKNSPAGVISISTNDPGNILEGVVRTGYEFNADERFIEGAVSVPVTDRFAVRIAGRASGMKGYLRNKAVGYAVNPLVAQASYLSAFPVPSANSGRSPMSDDQAARFTALWKPTDDLTLKFKYAYALGHANGDNGSLEVLCRPGAQFPTTRGVADVQSDCKANQETALSNFPVGLTVNQSGANGGVAYANTKTHLTSFNLDYSADKFSISSTTGYYKLDYAGAQNAYSDSMATAWAVQTEKSSGFSQEVRLNTDFDFPINTVLGAYYGKTKQANVSVAYTANLGYDPVNASYYSYDRFISQTATTYSAFGQLRWNIFETLELDAGARYTRERRTDFNGNRYLHPRLTGSRPVGDYFDRAKTFTDWSPEATLTWHPVTDQTIYAAYKTGYKSGGFSAPPVLTTLFTDLGTRFEPEDVEGFEVGYKARLFDRRLNFELAAYRYNYSNQQVSVFIPEALGFIVSNAGKSRVQGVEAQVTFRATTELTINAALGYNDAHFISYTGAACFPGQTAVQGCLPTGVGTATAQALSGRTLPRAPKWAGNFGGVYETPIGETLKIRLSAGTVYSSRYNTTDSLDPFTITKSFWKVNAAVALTSIDDKFEVALIGRNITDVYAAVNSQSKALGTAGNYNTYFGRPREVSLQATIRF